MITDAPEFKKAIPIIEKIEAAGYEAYFVGGCVRDSLLHLPISDVDIASSAMPTEIQKIFPVTFDVGIQHGTVMVLHEKETYEITTFRTESKYEKFRRPEKVHYVRSLKEDLRRRDFTINAIAMDKNSRLHDFFAGKDDLEKKLIRAVGNPEERFREDALRMMRAARFISQLNFDIEEKTRQAIVDYHPLLSKIAVERIREEWVKLLTGRNRKSGIKFFIEARLFQMCPGFQNRANELADLALFPLNFKNSRMAWIALIYFFGLPADQVESFLRKWKCSKAEITDIEKGVHALRARMNRFWDNQLLFGTGLEIAAEIEMMMEGFGIASSMEALQEMDQRLPIHTVKDIAVDGKTIMSLLGLHRGGPVVGTILADLKEKILNGELENREAALSDYITKRRMIFLDEASMEKFTVKEAQLASVMGSGDLPVLASPALAAQMERACKEMARSILSAGHTTVGIEFNLHHTAPSALGDLVSIEAKLIRQSKNKLQFLIRAFAKGKEVARAEHTRAIVQTEKFMNKVTKTVEEDSRD